MASSSGFGGFSTINTASLKQIVHLSPIAGKELLAEELGIPPYMDSQDIQKAPFITYIYDNIMFASEKGFPWEHISLVVKIAHDLLKNFLVEGHQIADAIRDYKEQSKTLEPLSDRHKQQYTDFIYETLLCHYNLYKYVFSHLRDVVHPKVKKNVDVPVVPPPLKEGKSINVWEYEEKLKAISKKENVEKEEQDRKLQLAKDTLPEHKTLDELDEIPIPYSKMTLSELVKDVLQGYTETKEKELKVKVEGTAKELEYKLEKTALPRPAVLGSPPRFKPKSPIGLRTPNASSINLKTERGSKSARSRSGRASAASNVSKK